MSKFWLSEEQFERLLPLLPNKVRRVALVEDRRGISGIINIGNERSTARCAAKNMLFNRFMRCAAKSM